MTDAQNKHVADYLLILHGSSKPSPWASESERWNCCAKRVFCSLSTGCLGGMGDPHLEPLWDYPPFQELMRPQG